MVNANALAGKVRDCIRSVYGSGRIDLHRPFIAREDIKFVEHALATEPVGYGYIEEFEAELRLTTGARHAIAVSSGTAALHLALVAVGVKPNDTVSMPLLTFAGAAAAVRYCGAHPTFATVGERPTAAMGVHILGTPNPSIAGEWVLSRGKPERLPHIEDAAAALGSRYGGRMCGTFGTVGILSFNNNKIVTTGGGGAVLTDSDDIAQVVRHLATTAKKPSPFLFDHDAVGFNYRMNNMAAALGLGQLLRLPSILRAKRKLHEAYQEAFGALEEVQLCTDDDPEAQPNHWLNAIDVPSDCRDVIIMTLLDDEVACRALFTPLPDLWMYANAPVDPDRLREARVAFQTTICIPSGAMS